MASPAAIGSGRPAIEIGRNPRRGRYAVCFSSKIAGPQRGARGAKKTPRAFLFLRYVQGGGRSAEALRTTGQIQPVRMAGLAHWVRAKRGPMTGSGVTRLSVGDERRITLRQSALRAGLGLDYCSPTQVVVPSVSWAAVLQGTALTVLVETPSRPTMFNPGPVTTASGKRPPIGRSGAAPGAAAGA
jgi:hypothetical protein